MHPNGDDSRPPNYPTRPEGQQQAQQIDRAQHQPGPQSGPSPQADGSSFLAGLGSYNETKRYTVHSLIGKGSYGVVCAAKDNLTGEMVAIKKIQNVFDNVADAHRILREITLLRVLRHPDIVEIKHIMLPSDPNTFKDLYVCFELMESDLHTVIGANDDLTADHHKVFLFQLLRGLNFMHTNGVLHRDLKPKNILANSNCKLKICDFGLARPYLLAGASAAPLTPVLWTDYVATRWYRAPELCGCFYGRYNSAVDMWSIGCIFAEVLLGKPLFPGRDAVSQLQLITDLLGKPPQHVIDAIGNVRARKFLQALPQKEPRPLSSKFPAADPLALDLLARLLAFDPAERPTAADALAHPYFSGLPNAVNQEAVPIAANFEFEHCPRLSESDVRHLIYREALQYHPHVLRAYEAQVAALQQQQAAAAAQAQAAQAAQAAHAAQAAQAQALAAQASMRVSSNGGLSPASTAARSQHQHHLYSGISSITGLMEGPVPHAGSLAGNPYTLASTPSDAVSLAFMLHAQDSMSSGGSSQQLGSMSSAGSFLQQHHHGLAQQQHQGHVLQQQQHQGHVLQQQQHQGHVLQQQQHQTSLAPPPGFGGSVGQAWGQQQQQPQQQQSQYLQSYQTVPYPSYGNQQQQQSQHNPPLQHKPLSSGGLSPSAGSAAAAGWPGLPPPLPLQPQQQQQQQQRGGSTTTSGITPKYGAGNCW